MTLTVAKALHSRPVDEIHVMRKIVIDGSNTTGFQRTALVSLDGTIPTASGPVAIATICLEEDSARKVEERPGAVVYRLDRLGIPLIELATEPVIHSPEQAREAALAIGMLLRATRRVKRGIGTIRQDVNVSIPGGARVEIKGVQELRAIPPVIQNEADRQRELQELQRALVDRGFRAGDLAKNPTDVTDRFRGSASKLVRSAIDAGGRILAVRLPGFAGLLKSPQGRFGRELAGHARSVGLKGLLHTDELPGYGIEAPDVEWLRSTLGAGAMDAVIVTAGPAPVAQRAVHAVLERAAAAVAGVPSEVRRALPDDTSEFLRPMPGAARMYPETDVPPILVKPDLVRSLPVLEPPEATMGRLRTSFSISEEQARQLVQEGRDDVFEAIAAAGSAPAIAATLLTGTLTELASAGVETERATVPVLNQLLEAQRAGRIAKEGIGAVLRTVCTDGLSVADAISRSGLSGVGEEAARSRVRAIVEQQTDSVRAKGARAADLVMGLVMAELRGKLDGRVLKRLVDEEITRHLGTGGAGGPG